MLKVKTFADQDGARVQISELTARVVEDVLYILDSATGPDGIDNVDPAPSPEISEAYNEFRGWFGPQVGAAVQGLLVGPLLSRLSVDHDGRAYIEADGPSVTSYAPQVDRLKSRITWLVEEIPSLVSTYSELLDGEADDALACVSAASALGFDSQEDRAALREMLPELERWFMFSNPGAKILRGDEDAIKALLDGTERIRAKVKEFEASRKSALDSTSEVSAEQVDELNRELMRVEAQIVKAEGRLSKLDKRRARLVEMISE